MHKVMYKFAEEVIDADKPEESLHKSTDNPSFGAAYNRHVIGDGNSAKSDTIGRVEQF